MSLDTKKKCTASGDQVMRAKTIEAMTISAIRPKIACWTRILRIWRLEILDFFLLMGTIIPRRAGLRPAAAAVLDVLREAASDRRDGDLSPGANGAKIGRIHRLTTGGGRVGSQPTGWLLRVGRYPSYDLKNFLDY